MKTLVIFLFCFTSVCYTQVNEVWVKRLSSTGNNAESPRYVALDAAGNIYVTGGLVRPGNKLDLTVIKYNPDGSEAWTVFYNSPDNDDDVGNHIELDAAGNIFVTGSSIRPGTAVDYLTIKFNSSGVQQWAATYNGIGNGIDEGRRLALDQLGNIYVTGRSRGTGVSDLDWDIATVKYSSAGAQQWVQIMAGAPEAWDEGVAAAVDGAGNIYVAGMLSASVALFDWNYVVIKYSPSGSEIWNRVYNGAMNSGDPPTSMVLDASGNVIVTGMSVLTAGQYDAATIKYDSAGVQQWLVTYNGPSSGSDGGQAITTDAAGNIYITGHSGGTGTNNDFFTIKYNPAGAQQWLARYNGPGNSSDQGNSIVTDAEGNVYVTGQSIGTGGGINTDFATIKYNSSGAEQWVQRYNGPGNNADEALCIKVDGNGNVYITGRSRGSGTNYDFATIKYSQVVGIQNISSDIPNNFRLYNNYPNPFNPVTKIKFDIPSQAFTKITVYDVTGKEAALLLSSELNAGSYEVDFSGDGFSSGVYFYRITSGEFTDIKKMIMVK